MRRTCPTRRGSPRRSFIKFLAQVIFPPFFSTPSTFHSPIPFPSAVPSFHSLVLAPASRTHTHARVPGQVFILPSFFRLLIDLQVEPARERIRHLDLVHSHQHSYFRRKAGTLVSFCGRTGLTSRFLSRAPPPTHKLPYAAMCADDRKSRGRLTSSARANTLYFLGFEWTVDTF